MITGKTQLNAVIGVPLGHSKSPGLHNALYKKLGIDAVMLAFAHRDLKKLISAIKTLNIGLTAVTMPFKRTVIPFLDKIERSAKAMDSVNTIINKNQKLFGYNTDIDGIAGALKGIRIKGKRVLIIGAGGAARAAAYYIKQQKGELLYKNRTKERAEDLLKYFGGRIASEEDLESAQIIINATPMGMHPKVKATPLQKKFIKKGQLIFDLVYNPNATRLIQEARKVGAATISGAKMFAAQALRQLELYSGQKLRTESVKNFAEKILV